MKHDLEFVDFGKALTAREKVHLGHYFAFVDAGAEGSAQGREGDRFSRLLANEGAVRRGAAQVLPLLHEAVECVGVRIVPRRELLPLACVVADRDLYRAEEDVAQLFCALPGGPAAAGLLEPILCIEQDGLPLTERKLELDAQGIAIESLASLLPGSYSAYIEIGGERISEPARFSAAEYGLAPLSARLTSHDLRRAEQRLGFELAVESYQLPYDGKLRVELIDAGRAVKETKVKAHAPGSYRGEIKLKGEGPFRLRLSAMDDAERIAEVALPGSRADERDLTVLSELGQQRLFSMLPEPGALPLRGGFVSTGDTINTPLVIDELCAHKREVRVLRDAEGLTAVSLDLATGQLHVDVLGDVKAESAVEVPPHGPLTTVFFGAYIGGRPFEGYGSFATPAKRKLSLEVAERARPGDVLTVALKLDGGSDQATHGSSAPAKDGGPYRSAPSERLSDDALPKVLVSIRDERLTATDTPDVALGAAAKRAVAAATREMSDSGLTSLAHALPLPPPAFGGGFAGGIPPMAAPAGAPRDEEMVFGAADVPPPMMALDECAAEPEPRMLATRARAAAPVPEETMKRTVVAAKSASAQTLLKEETVEDLDAEGEAGLPPPPARESLPEQLFYGLLPLRDGQASLRLPLPDSLATFRVEAFAIVDGDWQREQAAVVVDQPVRVDLELPPAIHPGDDVLGRIRATSGSGRLKLGLERDGRPVELRDADGKRVDAEGPLRGPLELSFVAEPGAYTATVEDLDSGETDRLSRDVGEPGKLRTVVRELGLLQRGDVITLDSANALTLRVLPGLDEPFSQLTRATAGYAHLCCEQTAAKILAAVLMYLTSEGEADKRLAERIILAGIAREKKMRAEGKGFYMYPGETYVSEYYSELAVRYLWGLGRLNSLKGISPALRRAAEQGIELADGAARDHRISKTPAKPTSCAEAYALATAKGGDQTRARAFIDEAVSVKGKDVALRAHKHAVADRAELAYGAAACIALGDLARGLVIANQITRQLNDQGALYSTVDSAAAIALLLELRGAGVMDSGGGKVKVNGREMSAGEATELTDQVESVEVVEGVAAVEVAVLREEDWNTFGDGVPLRVGLRERGQPVHEVRPGQRVDLQVTLPEGYEAGDLVHVMLPAALSRIDGGAKVKRFSVDFEGKSELSVQLLVTSKLEGVQHFAVCLRNMFEEERGASPGLMKLAG